MSDCILFFSDSDKKRSLIKSVQKTENCFFFQLHILCHTLSNIISRVLTDLQLLNGGCQIRNIDCSNVSSDSLIFQRIGDQFIINGAV